MAVRTCLSIIPTSQPRVFVSSMTGRKSSLKQDRAARDLKQWTSNPVDTCKNTTAQMFNIFEQPYLLLLAAISVLIVTLIVHSLFPQTSRWPQLLLPLLLAVFAFGIDYLVQTDTEKIKTTIKAAAKSVREENPRAIEPLVSPQYSDSYHKSKAALIAHCTAVLSEPLVDKNITRFLRIDIHPPDATVLCTANMVFDKRSYVYQSYKQLVLVKMKIHLQKNPAEKWLISRCELLEIDRLPAKWRNIAY